MHAPFALKLCGTSEEWGGSPYVLPGWQEGAFEVQDAGAQLISLACDVRPGEVQYPWSVFFLVFAQLSLSLSHATLAPGEDNTCTLGVFNPITS